MRRRARFSFPSGIPRGQSHALESCPEVTVVSADYRMLILGEANRRKSKLVTGIVIEDDVSVTFRPFAQHDPPFNGGVFDSSVPNRSENHFGLRRRYNRGTQIDAMRIGFVTAVGDLVDNEFANVTCIQLNIIRSVDTERLTGAV
jgi:hypothetical protein